MSSEQTHLSDQEFLQKFENQTLDPEYFDHHGHLRLAWLYLSLFPLEQAIDKICAGIRDYAESLGATEKFNKTITIAIVKIMANRTSGTARNCFEQFLNENQPLLKDSLSVLLEYYSPEVLFSEHARIGEVKPDIKEFESLSATQLGAALIKERSEHD